MVVNGVGGIVQRPYLFSVVSLFSPPNFPCFFPTYPTIFLCYSRPSVPPVFQSFNFLFPRVFKFPVSEVVNSFLPCHPFPSFLFRG